MSTWADLRALRQAGGRPSLSVWLMDGSNAMLRRNLCDAGAMVVDCQADALEVDLLADLDVRVAFDSCKAATPLALALATSAHKPASCRVWCECSGTLSTLCDQGCPR